MNDVEEAIAYIDPDYEAFTPPHYRTTPSGAVDWAWEQLRNKKRLFQAVDIGCGKGRNSIFLARKGINVIAIDFAPNAIAALEREAKRQGVSHKILALVQDAGEDWLVKTGETDLVVDAFCFKHLSLEASKIYKNNLLRVLNTWGHYLISFSSIGDGFYGHYIRRRDQPLMPVDDVVRIDPMNGIESPLYSREKVIQFLKPELEVVAELKNNLADTGKPETYALLFRRAPKYLA